MKDKLASAPKTVRDHVYRNRAKYAFVAGVITSNVFDRIDGVGQVRALIESSDA